MFIFLPSSLLGGRSYSNLREMEVFGDQNPRVFGPRERREEGKRKMEEMIQKFVFKAAVP